MLEGMKSTAPLSRVRTVFLGSPAFAVPSLAALVAASVPLVGVVTQPDSPSGRGKRLTVSPVKAWAVRHGLPVFQPQRMQDEREHAFLRKIAPDLLVVVAYGEILPREVLNISRLGAVNVHASLLPKYRGAAPIPAAILAGEAETGVTTMLLDEDVDTGPTLKKARVPIADDDTTATLSVQLAGSGANLLVSALRQWLEGSVTPQTQESSGASIAPMLKKEDGRVDWQTPATQIERMVRAYDPWPGAWTTWERGGQPLRLRIHRAEVLRDTTRDGERPPGTVFQTADGRIAVATGADSALILKAVQLQGRRRLPAPAFVRGHKEFLGALLQ